MFVDPAEASSQEYREFWARLNRGEFDRRPYKCIGKGGKELWIEASYNSVFRGDKPYKVAKFATDITAQKLKALRMPASSMRFARTSSSRRTARS